MFKKIVTIVLPIVAICAAIFVFGIKVYNESFDEFQYDGYVIGTPEGKESTRYYFTKDNRYKVNETKEEVTFANTDEVEVVVPNHAFVHYADGSIATFKKAVVLNVSNVKSSTIQYYNVYKGSVFTKATDGYQIKYLEQKLSFNNFLIKISETKYMLVGNNLQLKYGEETKNIKDGFLEINYLDGNIIRVENLDISLQNISADLHIETDGVKVDLLNKKISYNGETKVNLGEITIDSDDNIEIIPDDENTTIDGDIEHGVGYFEDQPLTRPGVDITGMQSGVVDTSTKKPDEIVEENAKIADAEFDVKSIDVTASSVNVNIGITDKAGVLSGNLNWKIVENATNQIACMGNQEHGKTTLSFSCNQLAPDTNYSVIVRSAYSKNEVPYEKDFVQKTFVTSTMGVTIDKDYVSTKAVSFLIKIDDYVGVSKFKYQLVGPEGTTTEIRTYTIPEAVDGVDPYTAYLTFENSADFAIRSNSRYTLVINEVEYGNIRLSETYKISKTLTTLKTAPQIGTSSVAINKQNSKFVLYLNNVKDPDNGILNYRADIYEVLPEQKLSDIITKREAPAASEMTIDVDGTIISRQTNYRAKLYITFFDNEKEYDIYIGNQEMNMNSVAGPAVTFEKTLITHERINGKITITDPNETIDLYKEIHVIQQNMSYGTSNTITVAPVSGDLITDKKRFTFPIEHNNLKSNNSYLYTVMAWVDYKDKNEYVYAEIGQFIINTEKPVELNASIRDDTGTNPGAAFTIAVKLDATTLDQQRDQYEISTMQAITFRVSGQEFDPAVHECIAANRCWEKKYTDQNEDDPYTSTLKRTFYDNEFVFTPEKLSINVSDLSYGNYKFEILGAYDYTQYQNDLPISNSVIYFNPNASADTVINAKVFTDTPIYNGSTTLVDKNEALYDDTIIGYKIIPDINLPTTNRDEYTITYTLHNLATDQEHEVTNSELIPIYKPENNDGNNTIAILFENINDPNFVFERGYPYSVQYKVTYKVSDSKTESVVSAEVPLRIQPVKQVPKFDVYLKTRLAANGAQIWKFEFEDIDGATKNDATSGLTAKYSQTTVESWTPVTCGNGYTNNRDCLLVENKEFATNLNNGSLAIALELELLKGAIDSGYNVYAVNERRRYIDEMVFFNVQDYVQDTTYSISKGPNDIRFIFDNYSSSMLSQQVANIKITFNNGSQSKVLYKTFDNNGYQNAGTNRAQVSIDFSEIAELMGEAEITPTIEFLYDKNISGFESENQNGNGFAFEETINSNSTLSKLNSAYKVFTKESFDYKNKLLKLTSIEGYTTTINFSTSKKGIFYKNDSNQNVFINLKQLHNKSIRCSSECNFTFSNVMPTLYLEQNGIVPKIGGFKYKGNLIIDSSIPDLVVRTRYFATDAQGKCTDEELKVVDVSASSLSDPANFEYDENDLNRGQNYCIKFTWYKESDASQKEEDFYYGAEYHSNPNANATREYIAKTLESPILTNITIKYDTGYLKEGQDAYATATYDLKQHDDYNRSITVTFKASTIENYHGFKYRVLNADGKTEIANKDHVNIEDSIVYSINTFQTTFSIDASPTYQTLKANTKYVLEITPYRECSVESPEGVDAGNVNAGACENGIELLKPTTKEFTFYIIKPTITISRVEYENDAADEFTVQIVVQDRYRAVGGYSKNNPKDATYVVSVINDKGEKKIFDEPIIGKSVWTSKKYTNIDHCKDSQLCTIEVVYESDTINEGNRLQYTITKDIAVASDIDLGTSSILLASTTQIKIGFADSYKIEEAKTYDYTLSDSTTGTAISDSDVEAVWVIDATENYYYLTIPVSIPKGRYALTISFKDEHDILVASNVYDVFVT